jgi:hypothetical protein
MTKPRGSGPNPEGWEQEQPRSAPQHLERTEWEKYDDRTRGGVSGSRISRISSEMRPVVLPAGNIYYPHGGYQYQK